MLWYCVRVWIGKCPQLWNCVVQQLISVKCSFISAGCLTPEIKCDVDRADDLISLNVLLLF